MPISWPRSIGNLWCSCPIRAVRAEVREAARGAIPEEIRVAADAVVENVRLLREVAEDERE